MNVNQLKQRSAAVIFTAVLVLSGCHKKVAPPPTPPPPPPTPAPTANITANPVAIQQGQSSTLSWTTANANQVVITGLGTVSADGSRSVTPTRSTDYTVTATGANGASVQAAIRVTVTQPPPSAVPSATDEELFAQNVRDVYFNYDKYDLRPADTSTVEQDASFLKSHPGIKILIEGHCDDRGSVEYNIALGQNRAEALQKALTNEGVDASRVRIISYGEEKPFCTEESESCWQQNRRDHLKFDH